ncbi:hypothetical protein PtA15_11A212 [Puccinia triticina]|uniref:Uncharacterized protein n=1 Tax=Puccinia triticina TaxID=208348 RepID=A0ABY7CX71_9BASI|nr:uncharacterized protein PtA15_11A212 [Puccinia triticina]WAQ89523.1 hypothetical protein PtA15_11A212 [Puccinia triticina]
MKRKTSAVEFSHTIQGLNELSTFSQLIQITPQTASSMGGLEEAQSNLRPHKPKFDKESTQ